MSESGQVRKLERRSSGELVADHLRREIFAGRLVPGEKIPQEDVAKALGVSRVPVREALVILENEGRVQLEHPRGAFVLAMDAESVRDNAEIFGRLFGFIARRAAERRTPELDERLAVIRDALLEASAPGDIWRLAEGYLDVVMEVGAAPRLAHALRRMRTLAVDNLFDVAPATLEITRTGTIALIDAITAGDADRAEAEQMAMQRASSELVVDAFAGRGMLGQGEADEP